MALSVIDHVTDMNIRVRLAEQLLVQIKDGCFENLWIRSPPRVASLTQVLTKWNDCAGVPAKRWACAHFIPPCESHPPSVSGMHTRMKLSDFSGTCSRCWVAKHQKVCLALQHLCAPEPTVLWAWCLGFMCESYTEAYNPTIKQL